VVPLFSPEPSFSHTRALTLLRKPITRASERRCLQFFGAKAKSANTVHRGGSAFRFDVMLMTRPVDEYWAKGSDAIREWNGHGGVATILCRFGEQVMITHRINASNFCVAPVPLHASRAAATYRWPGVEDHTALLAPHHCLTRHCTSEPYYCASGMWVASKAVRFRLETAISRWKGWQAANRTEPQARSVELRECRELRVHRMPRRLWFRLRWKRSQSAIQISLVTRCRDRGHGYGPRVQAPGEI